MNLCSLLVFSYIFILIEIFSILANGILIKVKGKLRLFLFVFTVQDRIVP